MSTITPELHDSPQRGLLFLRGQGETTWVPHGGVPWLRETAAGLEVDVDDALREVTRQNRVGLVLLGHPGDGKTHALRRLASLCRAGEGARLGLSPETEASTVDLGSWRPEVGAVDSWLEKIAPDNTDSPSLLLVDGLGRLDLQDRRTASNWLRASVAANPSRRLVVTCRFDGYEPETELGNAFLEVQLCSPPGSDRRARPEPRDAARTDPSTLPGTIHAQRGGYQLTAIPGGRFRMGSPANEPGRWSDEEPTRLVDVAPFHLGLKPVTNREFALFLHAVASEPEPGYWQDPRFNHASQPVVGVSWEQARRYATWAGSRLPSEAEWEYACRATTSGERYGDLDAVAWHAGNSGGTLHPVGTRAANAWGLFDMLGNAWEWVEDDHHPNYEGAPMDGRPWIDEPRGARRLLRGGSWADNPRTVRAATRLTNHPGPRVGNIGFRLAADGS